LDPQDFDFLDPDPRGQNINQKLKNNFYSTRFGPSSSTPNNELVDHAVLSVYKN